MALLFMIIIIIIIIIIMIIIIHILLLLPMITNNGQGHQCLCYSGQRSAWKPSLADARRNINSSRCLKYHKKNRV